MVPPPLAIVTGASSGIGQAIAVLLAQRGYAMRLIDLDQEGAESTRGRCAEYGAEVEITLGDVSDGACWEDMRQAIGAERRVALLVNAAGVLLVGSIADCSSEALRRVIEVNLIGTMLGCRSVVPLLEAHERAALPVGVLNIASIFAVASPPRFTAYCASKGGVVAMTESLRHELKPLGFTATTALPGVTQSALFRRARYGCQGETETQALKKVIQDYTAQNEMRAERVAAESLDGYARGEARVTVGRKAKQYSLLARLVPSLMRWGVARNAASQFG